MTDAENIELLEGLLKVCNENNRKHLAMIEEFQKDAAVARLRLCQALQCMGGGEDA